MVCPLSLGIQSTIQFFVLGRVVQTGGCITAAATTTNNPLFVVQARIYNYTVQHTEREWAVSTISVVSLRFHVV